MASELCYLTSTSTLEDCQPPCLPHRHRAPHPASTTPGHRGFLGVFLTASAGTAQPAGWTQPLLEVRVRSCSGMLHSAKNLIMRDGASEVFITPDQQLKLLMLILKIKVCTTLCKLENCSYAVLVLEI